VRSHRHTAQSLGARLLPVGLAALAAYGLALGILMAVAPGTFYAEIGPFGPRNDHYIRDTATFNLALGMVAFVAVRRASWRLPVLAFAVVQFGLHSVNHLVDIDEAEPAWVGPADFAGLVVATLLLALLIAGARREGSST
jgi:peptidoglycan/LPS O-acetylase OafA/YrhL